jgi:hypothetical protein
VFEVGFLGFSKTNPLLIIVSENEEDASAMHRRVMKTLEALPESTWRMPNELIDLTALGREQLGWAESVAQMRNTFLTKTSGAVTCHLFEKERLTQDDLKFKDVEQIVEDDKFELAACRCLECGKLYLRCFSEINFPGVDDYWSYFVSISATELEEVKRHLKTALQLFGSREHILCMPGGKIFRTKGLSGGLSNPVSLAHYYLR